MSTDDRVINPADERHMAERMNPRAVIELAHASSTSQPGPVADLIEKAANELSGRRHRGTP
ncbi:hypothetical protein [Streptomyces sp. NPDC058247]|uniref:hypothetical protein n=1 Tax=Streptomyces sp. NPDC058247 TaxID=3346401 RepID=UPI0036EC0217